MCSAKCVLITPLWDPRAAKHGSHERVLEMTPRNGRGGDTAQQPSRKLLLFSSLGGGEGLLLMMGWIRTDGYF